MSGPALIGWLALGVFSYFNRRTRETDLTRLIVALLPAGLIIHYVAFRLVTDLLFRVPYALHVLPALLLGSASGAHALHDKLRDVLGPMLTLASAIVITSLLVGMQGWASADFKSRRIKPDWRGLTEFLSARFGTSDVIVFTTIEPKPHWKPTFYGFPRYYAGASKLLALGDAPIAHRALTESPHRPVLVVYHYRDYLLTGTARHPIMPAVRDSPFQWERANWPEWLQRREFAGFTVLFLAHPCAASETCTLRRDLHRILDEVIERVPRDAGRVDLHRTAALLTRKTRIDHASEHFRDALELARPAQRAALLELDDLVSARGGVGVVRDEQLR